jgi:nucleoside-diphosphate-sugar epimerase/glyoxylase-like metal-dependent hydrolase (beta-lactamase superfamily II)
MSSEALLTAVRAELGEAPLKILVTGGTGFVGSHLARVLDGAGHQVTICGRNRYRYPLTGTGIRLRELDLSDRASVVELCRGQQLVFHAGAKSSPWGTRDEFRAANVKGTRNVVEACLLHGVRRLIHVSSTAIHFEYRDKLGIREDDPFPADFCCEYAESKAEAETVIAEAVTQGLDAVVIRARAVFGPGDNALLPRLIAAAMQRRLRQIGDGRNQIDMTYIDNLLLGLILAAGRVRAGQICTITNDEPILLWPLLRTVLDELQIECSLRPIPRFVADLAARAMELHHRWFKKPGEPVMTRYTAGLLSHHQTFDLSEARTKLGYAPIVSMRDGVQITLRSLKAKDESTARQSVTLRLFTTGYTAHPAHLAEVGASRRTTLRFHAMIGVIEHPTEGLTLFDTGYSPRFFDAAKRFPMSLYARITPVVTGPNVAAVEILRRQGIDPSSVRRIVLSHFHADHACGLRDFPDAEVITSANAWNAIAGRRGLDAVRRAVLPDLFPPDLAQRLRLIEHFHGPGFGPFRSTHDLFGDGSVRMVDLNGHAIGQIGLLLQRSVSTQNVHLQKGSRCLLAADAVWTTRAIREDLPATLGFRLLAASAGEARKTQHLLHLLSQQFPDLELIPTHCPETAARYGFDEQLREAGVAGRDLGAGSVSNP